MNNCKTTYEALNSQLVEELPTLIEVSRNIFMMVISEFVLARKLFVGRITKELLTLMDVSFFLLRLIYCEKPTKFCEISTLLLSYVVPVESKVKISQNFVVFSEYMNCKNKIKLRLRRDSNTGSPVY